MEKERMKSYYSCYFFLFEISAHILPLWGLPFLILPWQSLQQHPSLTKPFRLMLPHHVVKARMVVLGYRGLPEGSGFQLEEANTGVTSRIKGQTKIRVLCPPWSCSWSRRRLSMHQKESKHTPDARQWPTHSGGRWIKGFLELEKE